MRLIIRTLLLGTLAVSLAACLGSRHYAGHGKYMVQGPGYHVVSGPYPDSISCNHAIPEKLHGRTYVCIFMPSDVRPNIWKRAS